MKHNLKLCKHCFEFFREDGIAKHSFACAERKSQRNREADERVLKIWTERKEQEHRA